MAQSDRPVETRPVPEPTGVYVPPEPASELVRVLDQYLADLQAGRAPDRGRVLAEHPDLAGELEQCLAGIEFMHRAAHPPAGVPLRLGDFQIVRELGRGGMGVVYEAEQLSLRRKVALKVLRFGGAADEQAMHRFQREAETVARLHHTNIVPIFAVGCEHGVHYYAMQFIEGRSLADVVAEGKAVPPADIARWGLQAAEALAHAHQRGVIHRDVKPSNLLLDPDGTLWLTDFGLAKRADEVTLTLAGVLMGTPRYMSPEQATGLKQPLDQRTDIYSLGATLYELATGRPVFEADTPHGVISQILNAEPVPPRQVRRQLPRDLETIILKCLAKDPDQRYRSAQELAEDLRSFLLGRGIRARRASLSQRAARWARRHPRVVTAGLSVPATVLVAVGAFLGWHWYNEWHTGRIVLATDGRPLVAAVLDDADRDVVPPFTVPTQQPVPVRSGAYRIRFSGGDQLSETYHAFVDRLFPTEGHVDLGERKPWEPRPLPPNSKSRCIDLAGHADVMVATGPSLRRLDGPTGREVWSVQLPWETALPVSPARDLNGDQVRDLVCPARQKAALAAVSGKDGKILWQHVAEPDLPMPRQEVSTAILGRPIAVDVGGKPAFVALVAWSGNHRLPDRNDYRSGTWFWAEAAAGQTGRTLWRRELGFIEHSIGMFEPHKVAAAVDVVRAGGKTCLGVVCDRYLGLLDPETGEPVKPVRALDFRPAPLVRLGNFDGPGALVLRGGENQQPANLVAVSLVSGATLWQATISGVAALPTPFNQVPPPEWPLVADLDGDGRSEVVVVRYDNPGSIGPAEIEVLDAAGQSLWRHRLDPVTPVPNTGCIRLTIGPDLDCDGRRDVYVAALLPGNPSSPPNNVVLVEALSGKDGMVLWQSRQIVGWYGAALNNPMGPLSWWDHGTDGRPQLVVPRFAGETWTLSVLDGGSGRLVHVVTEFGLPEVADLNGDGIPDLCGHGTDKLHALLGTPPEAWRWLASGWQRIHDYDGDGVADLMKVWHHRWLLIVSGSDGRVLVSRDLEYVQRPWWFPTADVNGDGVPDLFVAGRGQPGPPLQVLSGKTGEVLWKADLGLRGGQSVDPLFLECRDVDGNGQPEVIFAYNLSPDSQHRQLWLTVLAADGRVKWRQPLSDPVDWTLLNGTINEYWPAVLDLNGDGTLDVAAWGISPEGKYELRALDGKDGKLLWRQPVSDQELNVFLVARTMVVVAADLNGNGRPEIIVPGRRRSVVNGATVPDRQDVQILSFRAADGSPRWSWQPPARPGSNAPSLEEGPFAVDLAGDRRGVGVLVNPWPGGNQPPQLFVLDAEGRPCQQGTVDHYERSPREHLRPFDLSGDGRRELLRIRDGKLFVTRKGLDEAAWQWAIPGGTGAIADILPADGDRPATVAVLAGGVLYGLDGSTGKLSWQCAGPGSPARVQGAKLVPTGSEAPGPYAVFDVVFGNSGSGCAVCRPTMPP